MTTKKTTAAKAGAKAKATPKPTIGRIVHFTPADGDKVCTAGPVAAIITAVHDAQCVNLQVFADEQRGPIHRTSVVLKAGKTDSYCWEWPPII